MLIFDPMKIGNRLLCFRKRLGLTQAEVAEYAGLSDRTYADIERGTVNMKIETTIRICTALQITPNDLLMEEPDDILLKQSELLKKLDACSRNQQETALRLLSVYLNSL